MELLRRALLLGCLLPGIWLLRLAPLDPLLTIVPLVQEASQQVPPDAVTPVSGPEWDRFLRDIDAVQQGLANDQRWRKSPEPAPGGAGPSLFYRPEDRPVGALLDKLATTGGTVYLSISRGGEDHRYRVDRRSWTRQDFRPGAGFTGRPSPPDSLQYRFQMAGFGVLLLGVALFALIPSPTRTRGGLAAGEIVLLAAGVLLFAAPIFATGGSVQALTRGLWLTVPCWALAAVAVHLFAKPGQNAPHPLFPPASDPPDAGGTPGRHLPTFLRWGLAMLVVAVGPLVALATVSFRLWNR